MDKNHKNTKYHKITYYTIIPYTIHSTCLLTYKLHSNGLFLVLVLRIVYGTQSDKITEIQIYGHVIPLYKALWFT